MKTAQQIEQEYLAFCKAVEKDAMNIVGLAGNGRSREAAEAAISLAQRALTQRNQYAMKQETAGEYDLKALQVDATSASNSETGWERDA